MAVGIFAGIPVQNYADALLWYTRLFGSDPAFYPHDTEAVWQLSENCHVYVIQDRRRAGGAMSMVWVDDPRSEVARIANSGIDPVGVEKHDNVWKYVFHDAEGNEIGIGGEVT